MKSILDGSAKTPSAAGLRVITACIEPIYAAAMRVRNIAFDRGIKRITPLGRPTISIGNLTTGGTGKTPVVRWLADRLRADGERPAILMRGYRGGDEQRELDRALNTTGTAVTVPVHADPSRVRGAAAVLADNPAISVFLLDDAFQHRAAARQFDLVLVNATSPFGFGHVLPRGLLREPMTGLARASAVLITHQSDVLPAALDEVISTVRKHTAAPLFRADHIATGLLDARTGDVRSTNSLTKGCPMMIAGIGDPEAFGRMVAHHADHPPPHRWFADHHNYSTDDWAELVAIARSLDCDRIITTEKDWTKLSTLATDALPVEVVQLSIQFAGDDEEKLYQMVRTALMPHQK